MKIEGLGEFALIERISRTLNMQPSRDIVLGIGDDTAVWQGKNEQYLATTDSLIEGVHFSPGTSTWREIGWKALAVNISDIAAMGGIPHYALLSLGLPPDTDVENVDALCYGFNDIDAEYDVAVVGGNISSAPVVMINVTLIGSAPDGILTRSAAVVGDKIAVTGCVGQSAAGLKMLTSGLIFDDETTTFLRNAHVRPLPRVAEGRILVKNGVKTAIDLSDGLLSDLTHILKASSLAAEVCIHKLPIHTIVRGRFGDDAVRLALSGGEDYELLFTAQEDIVEQVRNIMSTQLTVIGEIVVGERGSIALLDENRKRIEFRELGWDHFDSGKR